MLNAVEIGAAAGLATWQMLTRGRLGVGFLVGCLVGSVSGNPWLFGWWAGVGVAFSRLQEAFTLEHEQDLLDFRSEMFLRRLRHHLAGHGALAAALAVTPLPAGIERSDPQRTVDALADHWRSPVLHQLAELTAIANRHGGSLTAVIENLAQVLDRDRLRRQEHRSEEALQRTSIVLLALAPMAMYGGVAIFHPSFAQVISQTAPGHLIIVWITLSTGLAAEIVRWQILAR